MNYNQQNTQIINQLKKEVYDVRIEVERSLENHHRKEINLWYSIRNSKVNKGQRENNFYYEDNEDKIDELMKKPQMEIFEFLATKHLEKNQGYGETSKQFQTPCYLCNQKTLTTIGWNGEGYPDNSERFFCRLCRTSFGWIDIKEDPIELQKEMNAYYLTFAEKDLEKDEAKRKELVEEFDKLKQRQKKRRQFIEEIKASITKSKNHE